MAIPNLKANNVCMIIDNNDLVSYNNLSKSHSNIYPLVEKLRSFGWNAKACNGHKASEIFQSINFNNTNKPLALIAKTIKGYPISFSQINLFGTIDLRTRKNFQLQKDLI